MTKEETKEALRLAGRVATLATRLVGGECVATGREIIGAPIGASDDLAARLRDAVAAYDEHILACHEAGRKHES